jgi:hypothetical protein
LLYLSAEGLTVKASTRYYPKRALTLWSMVATDQKRPDEKTTFDHASIHV